MQTIEFNHEWKMRLLNRFLTYVKIYSTSDAESETTPSSPQQWDIAKYIFQELQDLGLSDVSMDENGYIMAYVPSNISENEPTVGFIAHYDTSPDFNGKDVNHKFGKITTVEIWCSTKKQASHFLLKNSQV